MKNKLPIALGLVATLSFVACSNNPEGAFDANEKSAQDSIDSLDQAAMFDDLYKDTLNRDTAKGKPGDVTTETRPKTPVESTPVEMHKP
ncbi:MAG: hypothetical protein EBR94_04265 [Bacteroidetes bacterium]|jgi:hypothetical protein|nr:hypothetical protein [Bacteroidota bacterium]